MYVYAFAMMTCVRNSVCEEENVRVCRAVLRRHAKLGGLVFDRLRALLFATAVCVFKDALPEIPTSTIKRKLNREVILFFIPRLFSMGQARKETGPKNIILRIFPIIHKATSEVKSGVIDCRQMSISALQQNGDSSPSSWDRRICPHQS